MSLDAMLAAHDEAALTALSSKGLMRRAQRDLEAGAAEITARSADAATIVTDGQTVEIDGRDVKSATCTCPASGTCRHVLLAILMLQANVAQSDAPEAPQASAIAEITTLDEAEVQKFAGADWAPAQKLASHGACIEDTGASCRVQLEATDASVTFIAGQGLKGAVYKGPRTRQRVFVTVAALLVRAQAGIEVSAVATIPDETKLDPAFCIDIADLLTRVVPGTLTGSAELAADNLFDSAISARAGAAPRLAAQLRSLSNMATLAAKRDIAFSATAFIEAAARCYGLALALQQTPHDPALTGSIARIYRDADALDLWVLGAASWRTGAGARGLTVYLFAPQDKLWYRHVTARGAGMDLSFNARSAYFGALWGAGSPESLKGTQLRLPAPKVSEDLQISSTLSQSATRLDAVFSEDTLSEMALHDWQSLRADLAERLGRGLRRTPSPQAALIRPHRFGALAFDDFAQVYRLHVLDQTGAALELTVSAQNEFTAPGLHASASDIAALLVEATPGDAGIAIRPVTMFLRDGKTIRVVDLDFHRFDKPANRTRLRDKLKNLLHRRTPDEADRLSQLCDDTVELLVDAISVPVDGQRIVSRLQAAGFNTLADATARACHSRTAREVMSAAYLAAELRIEIST